LAQAVLLDRAVPVQRLPGFAEGQVSVQDLAAQWAAPLLLELLGARSPRPRVLDACAAPGGKTAHLLELAKLDLWALDRDPERLEKVNETLARLHLKAHTLAADASDPHAWWDGQCFDAILLDAPCSASGIVRRHPDIRWLRRPEDIRALQKTQRELLHQLWPLLKPEGLLLYATCSVFKAEGQDVIHDFLSHTPEAQPCHPALGYLLPGLPDTQHQLSSPGDGFFYSLLRKIP
jgi:16S rRNA (cytosine967-C5)-methyltransferase